MVKSGADKFDIFSQVELVVVLPVALKEFLEKLDYSVIDVSNHLPGYVE